MKRIAVVLLAALALVWAEGAWLGDVPRANGTSPTIPKLAKQQAEVTPIVLQRPSDAQAVAVPAGWELSLGPLSTDLYELILEPTDNPDETLHYDDSCRNGVGLTSGGTFYTGARFTPTIGCTLKAVLFYQYQAAQNGYVYVYDESLTGTPKRTPLDSVAYTGSGTGWKRADFPPRVMPAGRDFWIGARTTHTAGQYPMGIDYRPPGVSGRSCFYTVNRVTWYDLSGSFGAWNLRAIVEPLPYNNDMGAITIDDLTSPQRPNQWITLKTTVKNLGINTQNSGVPVKIRIDGPSGYSFTDNDQVTLTNLVQNATEQITFAPQWRIPSTTGFYYLKAWTELSSDQDRTNDTVRMTLEVTNWLTYADWTSPYWYTWASPEKGTMFLPNEFGVSYPIQIESLKASFWRGTHVWRDSTFRFKIYGNDLGTLLYTSPWIEAVPPSGGGEVTVKHYLPTPVNITSGIFLVTVDCYGDSGYPDLLADGTSDSRSVYGDSTQWYYWTYGELMVASFVSWGAPPHDVGFTNVRAPWMYTEPGVAMAPRGVVRNTGQNNEAAVPCSCWVYDTTTDARVYAGYATIATLNAGDTATVTFPNWSVPTGNNVYEVDMATFLTGDGNRFNDSVWHVFMGFHVSSPLFSPRVTSAVTVDGYIDPTEWLDANRYDVSNILGMSDPYYRYFPGNVFLYAKHDANRLYLAADLPFQTGNDSFELGLYFDENNDGSWATDSTEGNYWPLHRPGASPVDSILYRSLPSGWRTTATGCVSKTSFVSGHMQFEVTLPFGTAKAWLNAAPAGDTLGFFMFAMHELYGMWPGWWLTTMDDAYWNVPGQYGKLILGMPVRYDVGVSQIVAPTGWVDTGATVTPTAKWRNYHTTGADFTAFYSMWNPAGSPVYSQSVAVTGLAAGAETTLVFAGHYVGTDTGDWSVRCSTYCAGDTNPANDVATGTFEVSKRPPVGGGWHEVEPMPVTPSTKAVKDGGWLAMDEESGLIYAGKGNKTGDFYKYDALGDTNGVWTQLTTIPNGTEAKPPAKGAMGVCDGDGHVYFVKGNNTQGFWRYNADSLTWTQLPPVPLGPSMKRVKGGTDMVYVKATGHDTGYVYLLKGYKQDFFRFNTATGVWDTSLPMAPAGMKPKWDKGSWLVLDKQPGHDIYNIYAHKAKYHELWVFNHLTLTWGTAALPGMPLTGMMGKSKKSKDGGSGALYEDAIYALKGGNTQEFWKCTLPAATWSERETIPAFGSTGKKKRVKGGGDIAAFGDGLFFALKGNKTLEMWRYSLGAVAAATPQRSGVMADRTAGPAGVAVASPARTSALVSFSLPQAGSVRITLIDVSGRTVAQRTIAAGRSGQTALDLRQLSAGVYLVRFDAAGFSATRKLVVE